MGTRRIIWGLAILIWTALPVVWSQPVVAVQERSDEAIGQIEQRLNRIREARSELSKRLEEARREGAERRVEELERESEKMREMLHRGEQELVDARKGRDRAPEAPDRPNPGEGEREQQRWRARLEHAEQAIRHLREADFPELAEMVARRTEELNREIHERQAARQQQAEALRQRQRAELAEQEAQRQAEGGDGSGRADRARQWEALNELRQQLEALRREVQELRRRDR